MASDRPDAPAASEALSESTLAWLDDRAGEHGLSRAEFLDRVVAAYRAAEEGDGVVTPADVAEVREELDAVDEEFDRKIQDVRERVIQVKRETDAKAPADHDHEALDERARAAADGVEELRSDVEGLRSALRALEGDLEALDETVAGVEANVDAGFENYEEILEYLTDEADAASARLDRLAGTVDELRSAVEAVAARQESTTAVEEIAAEANRHGVRTADCGSCGSRVDVALLARPECPYCAATFAGFEPKQGFLGSATLAIDDRPALESGGTGRDGDPVDADGGSGTAGFAPFEDDD